MPRFTSLIFSLVDVPAPPDVAVAPAILPPVFVCTFTLRGQGFGPACVPRPSAAFPTNSTEGRSFRRRHQGATVRRIESAVAAVGSDDQIGFGPRSMERPRALHGADHVVTALHDHPGNVADTRGVAEQLVIGFQETPIDEIVDLNAREGEGEFILFVVAGGGGGGGEVGRGRGGWWQEW